jgi:glyoxylase-like metal-dependent hydrolase (beta-lactamase superfamily II)
MTARIPHRPGVAALAAIACLCAAPALAQGDADVQITSTRVAGNVFMLQGQGGNMGACVGPDGILLIDDQFAPLAEKIRAALRALNPGPLQFILNTHYHGDHVGGNPVFGEEGTIIAQENVRRRLTVRQEFGDRVREPLPPSGWPVVTFADSVTVHFNGEDIRFVHLPAGHTDGDAIVFFPGANVLHMGDLMFTGRFPIVDIDSGGTVDGYIAALDWVLAHIPADARVIPGHGSLSTMADVAKLRDMIVATRDYLQSEMAAGKTLEQVKQAGLPAPFQSYETKSMPAGRWIDILYRSAMTQ